MPLMKAADVVENSGHCIYLIGIYIFFLLQLAVSFCVLFIAIQYAVFRKSIRTFYVSLCIYIYILKVVVCSTISIFRQQAAFVRNVQIKRYLIFNI